MARKKADETEREGARAMDLGPICDPADVLAIKLANLRRAGDRMASAIEERWSGPDGCDCECCEAAKAWRKARETA